MVAAKLDQSRVLVTNFRQNRLTLKGRSAGQRQTSRLVFTTAQLRPQVRMPPVRNARRIRVMSCHVMSCQRRRAVPLRPIWTITAAAKLDHSRVLVANFHRNRSTLKGRSAGQRHTLMSKASRGPSAADLEHYSRCQTRSE